MTLPTIADVEAARARIAEILRATPMLYSHTVSRAVGGEVHLKAECLQRTGSFKIRGAANRLRTLPAATPGVVCASAGNHAQGVALAARLGSLPAVVVMPESAPLNKIERTRGYGAEVILAGDSLEESYTTAHRVAAERGFYFVHPFDDAAVVAGQATLGLDILADLPEVGTVLVPTGGGGLVSGVALALKAHRPEVRVVAVQAEGAASALRSYRAGRVVAVPDARTLADGIRVATVSELTLELMRRHVDDVVAVDDEQLTHAMVTILDRSKLVVEPAAAASVAALLAGKAAIGPGPVCAVLSGGNIDLNLVARVVERGLTRAERYTVLEVRVADRPGSLMAVLATLNHHKVNVLEVKHHRAGYEVPVGEVLIELVVETRDRTHADDIIRALAAAGLAAARAVSV